MRGRCAAWLPWQLVLLAPERVPLGVRFSTLVALGLSLLLGGCLSFSSSDPPPPSHTTIVTPPGTVVVCPNGSAPPC
jgi:hypothetical protein